MWDCVIIGGGPAGLTAATYLGRFRRRVLVVDAGESRMKRIPLTRNAPGFPGGITGADLYARMREQAGLYGASFEDASVESIEIGNGPFKLVADAKAIQSRTVLLATGSHLIEPDVPDLERALERGLIRYCPICDAFEAADKRIAVLGGRPGAIKEAQFLRAYSNDVTFLWLAGAAPSARERDAALSAQIELGRAPVRSVEAKEDVRIVLEDGQQLIFDHVYPCLGCDPKSDLLKALGAELSDEGGIEVDAHQRTNIGGIYAAGDVVQGLDQIASACGHAAIAATTIHNDLRDGAPL